MSFVRGDVVQCKDEAAYARVEATLIQCDGSAFNKSCVPDEHKWKRPFIVVAEVAADEETGRGPMWLLCCISAGLPKVGGVKSFLMIIGYLSAGPDRLPYKVGSYIVYGLGAVAKESDLVRFWGKQRPDGTIQAVSAKNVKEWPLHDAAFTKCWAGCEHLPTNNLPAKPVTQPPPQAKPEVSPQKREHETSDPQLPTIK